MTSSTSTGPHHRDHVRARKFAAKWRADEHTGQPDDAALAAAFARCVKPPDAALYPLIRGHIAVFAAAVPGRVRPPDPRTVAEMIPVRLAEIAARKRLGKRCPTKGHGQCQPRPLERQTYEVMYCGVWYDCAQPGCGNGVHYLSRELAVYHGEPYNVDGQRFETWTGAEWVPVSRADVGAYWMAREWDREQRTAAMLATARRTQRARTAGAR